MTTVTNGELIEANRALGELAQERVPIAGALKVRQVWREVRARLEDVDGVIAQIVELHATRDDNGNIQQPSPGTIILSEEGQEEYAELMRQTVEFERGIQVVDLGDIQVRPTVLIGLGPLLED